METFHELEIDPAIQKAIKEMGFEKPSPVQAETLPLLLGQSTDFLGLAATGTGKTAAFGIPLIQRIDANLKVVQAIILCPTRELALQVSGQIGLLGKHKGVKAVTIYGGASYGDQIRGLRSGAQIVVGTPGRVVDHIDRKTLKLNQVQAVVLDEADEMISMGFKEDLEKILESTPEQGRNIWLFSATMSKGVRNVADQYLTNPKSVHINKKEMLSTTVQQIYYMTQESDKPQVLCKLIDAAEEFYGIVFCQTKSLVCDLTQFLHSSGYKVDSLHGDKDQFSRERTMRAFREKKVNILVCTDVASRGLDVKDITHVINYSLPRELDNYVHRIGRTARSGKEGFAMSLVTQSHRNLVRRIEQMTKSRMIEGKVPSRKDVGVKKVSARLEKFLSQNNFSKALELMDQKWKSAVAEMTAEEVAARFLAITYPEVFSDEPKVKGVVMPGGSAQSRGEPRRGDSHRRDSGGRRDSGRRDRGDRGGRRDDRRGRRDDRAARPERSARPDQNERVEDRSAPWGATTPRYRRDREAKKPGDRRFS